MSDEKKPSHLQKAGGAVVIAGTILASGWNMRDYMAQIEVLQAKVTAAQEQLAVKESELEKREAAMGACEDAGEKIEKDYESERELWEARFNALAEELRKVQEKKELEISFPNRGVKGFDTYQHEAINQKR